MHYRAISNRVSHFEVFRCEVIVYFSVPKNREATKSNMAIEESCAWFITSIRTNRTFHREVCRFPLRLTEGCRKKR